MSEKATQRPKDKTIDEKLAEMENEEAEFMMSEVKDMLGYGKKKKKKKKKYKMESFLIIQMLSKTMQKEEENSMRKMATSVQLRWGK